MAIKLTTTNISASHVKALVYGRAGVGKTTLCATAPAPIIISAEAGLLSLAAFNIPVIEITSAEDLKDAYLFITTSNDAKRFETVCLDSISDIGEVVLSDEKERAKDPRQAYGELADRMGKLIRSFRDLKGKHIYFTAKAKRITDEVGITTWVPSMPGQQLITNLPYWFDLVMPLRIGATEEGESYRYLQTQPDMIWDAKDRSGKLNKLEKPHLTELFNKITGGDISPLDEKIKAKPKTKPKAQPNPQDEKGDE